MKRINIPEVAYFITTNCAGRFPYFENELLCNLLQVTIEEVIINLDCKLIGYKINPDHAHIIIKTGTIKISDAMQAIKRISSIRLNQILNHHRRDSPYSNLEMSLLMKNICDQFYKRSLSHELPKFKWQKGFHDRLIRTPEQMNNCIVYLENQQSKHSLDKNIGLRIYRPVPKDVFYPGI